MVRSLSPGRREPTDFLLHGGAIGRRLRAAREVLAVGGERSGRVAAGLQRYAETGGCVGVGGVRDEGMAVEGDRLVDVAAGTQDFTEIGERVWVARVDLEGGAKLRFGVLEIPLANADDGEVDPRPRHGRV